MDWIERITGFDQIDHGNGSIEVMLLVLALAVLVALAYAVVKKR